jgi:serine phosphatase RsbU (regulator of sigma subunit)
MRAMSGERFVPILLLSALDEVSTLVEGLARGADDFLPKPFNLKVFESKLAVFRRMGDAQARLREQNRELARYREQTEVEHQLAQEVFDRIRARGAGDDPNVRMSASALAMFNGDVAITTRTPSHRFRWLLGDVAGHGLAGAIGTVPMSSIFYRTAKNDRSLSLSVTVLNDELYGTLPPRLFCATLVFELDPSRQKLTVINCGMPDALVLRPNGAVVALRSKNLPLGITGTLDPIFETLDVEAGTRVIAVSDGVVECSDPSGKMFGADRLRETICSAPPGHAFDAVLDHVRRFSQGTQSDDVSIVEVLI